MSLRTSASVDFVKLILCLCVHCYSHKVDGKNLNQTEEFKYLGYYITPTLSWEVHKVKMESRASTACAATAALMSRLEVSNLNSLRTYFMAMVQSQLFGAELVDFNHNGWDSLAATFLKKSFKLPRSFPTIICLSLLGLPPFQWCNVRRFLSFANRINMCTDEVIFHRNPARHCLYFDRAILSSSAGPSWSYSLWKLLADIVMPVEYLDLSPLSFPTEITDRLLQHVNASFRLRLQQSSSAFIFDFFSSGIVSPNFRKHLGSLQFEEARLIVLFMGNSLRWSIFRRPRRKCFFCDASLSSIHFFDCSYFPNPRRALPWQVSLRDANSGTWQPFFGNVLTCLWDWMSATDACTRSVADTLTLFEEKL